MWEIKVEHIVVIQRPIDEVYTYVTNLENLVEWAGAVIAVRQISPGVMQVGSRFRITSRFLGRWMESVYMVIEREPNSSLMMKSISAVAPCTYTYRFELDGSAGMKISQEAVLFLHLKGMYLEFAESVVADIARRQLEHDLLTLKGVLEAPAIQSESV